MGKAIYDHCNFGPRSLHTLIFNLQLGCLSCMCPVYDADHDSIIFVCSSLSINS
jgi:hypothetical protein